MPLFSSGQKWSSFGISSPNVVLPGALGDPDRDTVSGLLAFDSLASEVVPLGFNLPHDWEEKSKLIPFVNWRKTTSAIGNVLWKLDYEIIKPGGTFTGTPTALQSSTVAVETPDGDTALQSLVTRLPAIDLVGLNVGATLLTTLSRVAADVSDTYGADAELLFAGFFYHVDDIGSGAEFIK